MVPGYYWLEVEANNQSGSVTTKVNTLDVIHGPITSASLRAHVMLLNINHTAAQDSFAADCFISRYRQSGIDHSGHWRAISGPNITELDVSMSVNGCEARGGCLIELF